MTYDVITGELTFQDEVDELNQDELNTTLEEWYDAYVNGNNRTFLNASEKLATLLETTRGFGQRVRCPHCSGEECSH